MGKQEELERLAEAVRQRVEEILEGTGYYVIEVSVRGWPGSRSVEIYIDGEEGFTLEKSADVSREIRFVLDADEVFEDGYTLHVSSPGADRPLVDPRQFTKHVGRTLQVTFTDDDTAQEIRGELVAVDREGITLVDPGTGERTELPHEVVREATVELPW